ncbi:ribonuclease HII [Flavobacteriaceae bacterium GF1]
MLKKYRFPNTLAGTDEAGRGCLAGPVTAASIILPKDFEHTSLNDSKQLSEKIRDQLRPILEEGAISYGIAHVHEEEIDSINILNASILAMHRSLQQLTEEPEFILVDGNRFKPYNSVAHSCIVKGDSKFISIAAASILAKTHRDAYMAKIHEEFPMYNWIRNKGYPTKEHRQAIREHGLTKYHRKSFKQLPEQLTLEFG